MAPGARPEQLNLVASNLRLASLADDDPALVELRREVERETGIPAALTDTLIHALRGADHLGSLLKVDTVVDEALERHEATLGRAVDEQGDLFTGFSAEPERVAIGRAEAKATLLDRLEGFLARHTSGDDLGLRLRGEQLAAGVRFVRLVREGTYDLVVANPPYQGTSKMADDEVRHPDVPARQGRPLRGVPAARAGIGARRRRVGDAHDAELDVHQTVRGATRTPAWDALAWMRSGTSTGGLSRACPTNVLVSQFRYSLVSYPTFEAKALCPTPREDTSRDKNRTRRKRAATLCHEGRHNFDPDTLKVVPEWPLIYWWESSFLSRYSGAPKLAEAAQVKNGLQTNDDTRYLRRPWEHTATDTAQLPTSSSECSDTSAWIPYVKGAKGVRWKQSYDCCVNWGRNGLDIKVLNEWIYGSASRSVRSEDLYLPSRCRNDIYRALISALEHFDLPSIFDG